MSEKPIATNGKAFLVILLPLSFLIIFLVTAWKFLLALIVLLIGVNLLQLYQWQQWCQKVNPIFHQLVQDNQGRITPMDLAMRGNFSGSAAKRYLDSKASEFGASLLNSEDGNPVYYFINATILGGILDSSEPVKELPEKEPVSHSAGTLLAPPPPALQQEEADTESLPPATYEEVKKPLSKQLLFGSLIQSELAKRLNVYSSTVYKRRNDPDFPEWSRSRDPDGIAWSFSRSSREFFPLEEQSGKS